MILSTRITILSPIKPLHWHTILLKNITKLSIFNKFMKHKVRFFFVILAPRFRIIERVLMENCE